MLLPATLPGVIDTLRVTMGRAWTYLVVAELVGAYKGLGYMIMSSMRGLFTDSIFVAILVIGLLGLISDQILQAPPPLVLPWSPVALTERDPLARRALDRLTMRFRTRGGETVTALQTISSRGAGPRVRGPRRDLGVRQVDHPAPGRRAHAPTRRAASWSTAAAVDGPGADRGMVFQSPTRSSPGSPSSRTSQFGPRPPGIARGGARADRPRATSARSA